MMARSCARFRAVGVGLAAALVSVNAGADAWSPASKSAAASDALAGQNPSRPGSRDRRPGEPASPSAGRVEGSIITTIAEPPYGLTLGDCYRLALKRSEELAIREEAVKETEGRFLQALGSALPRVTYAISEKRQDGSGSSAFTLSRVPERRFAFSQPLFSGFKEFAAMAGSRAEHRERIQQRLRAEQLLLVDVADAFHLVLEKRETLAALEATHAALVERLDELAERERLGRSRRSEVASAEAQLRRVEADLEEARGDETVARQLLEFLTGLETIDVIVDPDQAPPPLEEEAAYLNKAVARPDVRAAEEAWHVAQRELNVTQAKFWPTVSLDGNYYNKRAGASADVKWDVTLTADIPIFQGGQAVGAVREASSLARQAQLQLALTTRQAELDIRDGYENFRSATAQSQALAKALEAADDSFRLQAEDYRLSLVNNLDVLQALQALEDARRAAIHARREAKRRYWQLKAATGATLQP